MRGREKTLQEQGHKLEKKKRKKKTYTKIIVYPYRSWVHLIMNGCNSFHRKATESSLQQDAFHSEPFSELNHPH